MPKRQSPTGLNPSSHRSEAGHSKARCSKASYLELEAERASAVPGREASEDCSDVTSDGGIQDQGSF